MNCCVNYIPPALLCDNEICPFSNVYRVACDMLNIKAKLLTNFPCLKHPPPSSQARSAAASYVTPTAAQVRTHPVQTRPPQYTQPPTRILPMPIGLRCVRVAS